MEKMSLISDAITLVCFFVFAIIGFRLWQVLGRRTGSEPPPQPTPKFQTKPLPTDLELKAAEPPPRKVWEGYAPAGSALAKSLIAIGNADPTFDMGHFVDGAKSAHERILNSFAAGDLPTLKLLLSPATYGTFEKEINRRAKAGEKAAFKFVAIKEAKPVEASLSDNDAAITMHFASEVVSAVKDAKGATISGDDKHIAEVAEAWTFERHLHSTEAGWKLAETHDGT